jgi:FecR protein
MRSRFFNTRLSTFLAAALLVCFALAFAAPRARAEEATQQDSRRSGYSYIRGLVGDVTVASRWNGRVDARRNMPISAGDEMIVAEAGRAEIGLADGNILHVGGGTRVRFDSLYAQQGEDADFSAVRLLEGSVVLAATGASEEEIPRVDTEDATVYLTAGSRVRVNVDSRRGTVVIGRYGNVDVKTPAGSYKLRAGQYLVAREDEEAQIERGSFSRDRFDNWAADRLEQLSETRSVSARYVDPEYSGDVESLDAYGDWSYNNTYSSYVWSPRVDAGWAPYSVGSWYYTPAGLTWWSGDPWGWQPFHYGNWFFDAAVSRWCWSPASVYSPAWVYWAYSPGYVGWCPIGWYSGFSPWWDNYYRRWGWNRPNTYLAVHGTFNPRQVDFRGWNFQNSGGFAGRGRAEVIPGSRLGERLGGQVAISSRPIVVPARPGEGREAVSNWVREAPRVIERGATPDSGRLAPILGRERVLPASAVEALRDRSVVADRGRLAGPAAADLAPRGVSVERARPTFDPRGRRDTVPAPSGVAPSGAAPSIAPAPSRNLEVPRGPRQGRPEGIDRAAPVRPAEEGWRFRGRAVEAAPAAPNAPAAVPAVPNAAPEARSGRGPARQTPDSWRFRGRPAESLPPASAAPPAAAEPAPRQDWRSRSDVPPARRVIDGAVPYRRPADSPAPPSETYRARPVPSAPREYRPEPRPESRPERREAAPPPPPRVERAPERAPAAPPPPAKSGPPTSEHERGRRN